MTSGSAPTQFPAAVLWDMDGTLIDSEPYWFVAEREVVNDYGHGRWSDDLSHQMIGSDLMDAAAFIQEHGGVALERVDIVERLLASVVAQLEQAVPWRPGARELLAELNDNGVPCVLVTMAWRPFADAVLGHLPDSFVTTITGDEVPAGRGKPDPTPYLMGAEAAGAPPEECIAIEDSATGARSAVDAGCQVLFVPNGHGNRAPPPGVHRLTSLATVSVADLSDYAKLER